jgi:hypothetical protein
MIWTQFEADLGFLSMIWADISIIVTYGLGYIDLFSNILMFWTRAIFTLRMLIGRDISPIKVWEVVLKIVHMKVIVLTVPYHIKM